MDNEKGKFIPVNRHKRNPTPQFLNEQRKDQTPIYLSEDDSPDDQIDSKSHRVKKKEVTASFGGLHNMPEFSSNLKSSVKLSEGEIFD